MAPTRRELLGTLGGLGAVALAGCTGEDGTGGQATTTTTTAAETTTTTEGEAPTTTTEQSMSGATVNVRTHDEYGEYLVDGEGLSLYMFDSDTQGEGASTCYDDCAQTWPPLIGEDPQTGDGVSASLSTFERDDGEMQVAANGWPLYYFASDSEPGDVEGQGVGDIWWLVDPAGEPIRGGAETTTTEGGGYEY